MSIEIEIAEAYQKLVSAKRLAAAVAAVLTHEAASGDVTLVVTDNAAIAQLNHEFLGEEGPTDVLSFPAQGDGDDGFVLPPDLDPYLGDIVIAYPYASAQAAARCPDRIEAAIAEELDLLAVHGALHLLGYDHLEPADEAIMWARQDAILQALHHA